MTLTSESTLTLIFTNKKYIIRSGLMSGVAIVLEFWLYDLFWRSLSQKQTPTFGSLT